MTNLHFTTSEPQNPERPESDRIGKCQNPFFAHFEQNLKVSESESVRFGKCQNCPILTLSNSDTFQFLPKWAKIVF